MLFVPLALMGMLLRTMFIRTPAASRASAALTVAASPHGPLEPRARLFGNTRACGLRFGRCWGRSRGVVLTFMSFLRAPVTTCSVFRKCGVLAGSGGRFSVFFRMFAGCIGGKRFIMHRVRDVFGLFSIRHVIVVQSVLQILEFGGFDEGFRAFFLDLRKLIDFRLRLFMLGFGQLLGQRAYFIIGKSPAVMCNNVRSFRNFSFGLGFVFKFTIGNFRRTRLLCISDRRGTEDRFGRK